MAVAGREDHDRQVARRTVFQLQRPGAEDVAGDHALLRRQHGQIIAVVDADAAAEQSRAVFVQRRQRRRPAGEGDRLPVRIDLRDGRVAAPPCGGALGQGNDGARRLHHHVGRFRAAGSVLQIVRRHADPGQPCVAAVGFALPALVGPAETAVFLEQAEERQSGLPRRAEVAVVNGELRHIPVVPHAEDRQRVDVARRADVQQRHGRPARLIAAVAVDVFRRVDPRRGDRVRHGRLSAALRGTLHIRGAIVDRRGQAQIRKLVCKSGASGVRPLLLRAAEPDIPQRRTARKIGAAEAAQRLREPDIRQRRALTAQVARVVIDPDRSRGKRMARTDGLPKNASPPEQATTLPGR